MIERESNNKVMMDNEKIEGQKYLSQGSTGQIGEINRAYFSDFWSSFYHLYFEKKDQVFDFEMVLNSYFLKNIQK